MVDHRCRGLEGVFIVLIIFASALGSVESILKAKQRRESLPDLSEHGNGCHWLLGNEFWPSIQISFGKRH